MTETKVYLNNLNKNQLKAATATGNVCVIAGAGTGKTQTLTAAVIDKIDNHNINPGRIFVATFTKKASKEMSDRIQAYNFSAPHFLGTFHANARKLIQRFPVLGGGIKVDKLTILDPDEAVIFAKDNVITKLSDDEIEAMCDLSLNSGMEKKTPSIKTLAKHFYYFVSAMKGAGINQEQLEDFKASSNYHLATKIDENPVGYNLAQKYYNTLRDAMRSQNAMDFDDLINVPVSVLRSNVDLQRRISESFDVIMVDEDQDTNNIQNEFVNMISLNASDNGTFFRVGDDGQSIYGWRGSEVSILRNFQDEADFVIPLEENYRSTQKILDYARGILQNDTDSNDKVLTASGEAGKIDRPQQIRHVNLSSTQKTFGEADFVADEITRRLRDDADPSDIVVLTRSNFVSKQVHRKLVARSVPSVCEDDDLFKLLGVRYLIAFGLVGLDPDNVINAVRLIDLFANSKMPVKGVGEKAIAKMVAVVHETGSFKQGMRIAYKNVNEHGKKMIAKMFEFSDAIEERWLSKGNEPDAAELFSYAFRFSGLQDHLTDSLMDIEDRLSYVKSGRGARKEREQLEKDQESINNTLETINEFIEMTDGVPVKEALEQIMFSKKISEDKENTNVVNVMTIHRSKGLEFPIVYVVGMDDDTLFKRAQPRSREWYEVIRLLYVAFTRAERELIVVGAPVSSIVSDLEADYDVKREMVL